MISTFKRWAETGRKPYGLCYENPTTSVQTPEQVGDSGISLGLIGSINPSFSFLNPTGGAGGAGGYANIGTFAPSISAAPDSANTIGGPIVIGGAGGGGGGASIFGGGGGGGQAGGGATAQEQNQSQSQYQDQAQSQTIVDPPQGLTALNLPTLSGLPSALSSALAPLIQQPFGNTTSNLTGGLPAMPGASSSSGMGMLPLIMNQGNNATPQMQAQMTPGTIDAPGGGSPTQGGLPPLQGGVAQSAPMAGGGGGLPWMPGQPLPMAAGNAGLPNLAMAPPGAGGAPSTASDAGGGPVNPYDFGQPGSGTEQPSQSLGGEASPLTGGAQDLPSQPIDAEDQGNINKLELATKDGNTLARTALDVYHAKRDAANNLARNEYGQWMQQGHAAQQAENGYLRQQQEIRTPAGRLGLVNHMKQRLFEQASPREQAMLSAAMYGAPKPSIMQAIGNWSNRYNAASIGARVRQQTAQDTMLHQLNEASESLANQYATSLPSMITNARETANAAFSNANKVTDQARLQNKADLAESMDRANLNFKALQLGSENTKGQETAYNNAVNRGLSAKRLQQTVRNTDLHAQDVANKGRNTDSEIKYRNWEMANPTSGRTGGKGATPTTTSAEWKSLGLDDVPMPTKGQGLEAYRQGLIPGIQNGDFSEEDGEKAYRAAKAKGWK